MRIVTARPAAFAVLLTLASVNAGAQRPGRELPPALGQPKPLTLPPKREFSLANGLKVTLVRFGALPKATVMMSVRTGRIDERSSEVALADITGETLREGTATRSAARIAETVADMGGDLTVSVGDDLTRVGGSVLTERAPEMVRLVSDLLRRPLLPETELSRVVAGKAREFAISRSQAQWQAWEQFASSMYGDHPYGRVFPADTMLGRYTADQVRDFHARNYGAARSHLYVVGVFDTADVERSVRDEFANWGAGRPPTVIPPTPRSQHSLTLIDRPNAVQSTIMLGVPVPDPAAADFAAMSVTDALLGGSFGSRITSNIREQKGYTYSPYSYVGTHHRDAYWVQQADVTTKFTGASLKEIFAEIDRLQRAAPDAPELEGIKQNMIGVFTLRNASRMGIAYQLAEADLQGLGDDYFSGYVTRVMAVTAVDVQRMAVTHLRPDRMTLVVIGDTATVGVQLAPFRRVVP